MMKLLLTEPWLTGAKKWPIFSILLSILDSNIHLLPWCLLELLRGIFAHLLSCTLPYFCLSAMGWFRAVCRHHVHAIDLKHRQHPWYQILYWALSPLKKNLSILCFFSTPSSCYPNFSAQPGISLCNPSPWPESHPTSRNKLMCLFRAHIPCILRRDISHVLMRQG